MKRIFSILLVCAMLFSMMTAVQAEDPAETIAIEYWNADSTKIVMDLSHEVDADELASKITLTANFAPVEFTVEKADKTISDTLPDSQVVTEGNNKVAALTPDTNYTYLVKPVDGITFDATYTLTIAKGLTTTDGSVTLGSDIVKGIMVEKLWVEDFDDYTAGNIPWVTNNGSIVPTLVEDENGGYALQTKYNGGAEWTLAPNTASTLGFADTGFTAKDFMAKSKPGTLYDNYNIELDAKVQTLDDMTYQHGILFNLKNNGSHVSNPSYGFRAFHVGIDAVGGEQNFRAAVVKSTYGSAYGGVTGANFETIAFNSANAQNYLKCLAPVPYAVAGEASAATSLLKNSVLSDTNLENDEINKISLSIKDNNMKFFANEGYISYGFTIALNEYGYFEIVQKSVGGSAVDTMYQIDNICVTKAKEIVFAPVEVVDWNADSSKITLDLSAEVDTDEIPSYLTLTKFGVEQTYTVTEKFQANPSTGALTDGAKTYVITPDDGMELDALYTLKIDSGLAAVDYSGMLEEEYKVSFAVNKVWSDDFESYDPASFDAWGTNSGLSTATDTTNVTLKETAGDAALRVTGGKNAIMNFTKSSALFGDTGVKASDKPNAKLMDYTVELKVGFESAVTGSSASADVRFLMMSTPHTNLSYTYALMGGVANASGTYYTSSFANASPGNKQNTQYANSGDVYYQASGNVYRNQINYSPFATSGENTVTLAAKGKNFKFFFGDEVFNSYNYTIDVENYGYVSILAASGTIALVDDIIVTRTTLYKDSSFSMDPADGAKDAAIGDTVKLTFEKPLAVGTVTADTIKVYADGTPVSGYTVSVDESDGKIAMIKFDEPFEYRTEYVVVPFGVGYEGDDNKYGFNSSSFTTTIPDVEVTLFEADGEMAELTEGSYDVTAEFINNKVTGGIKGIVSICLYDENNKMIDVATKAIDLKKGKDGSITDTWTIKTSGKYFAKCYIWDGFDTMNTVLTATLE